ncbi:MAG: hypothetical protein ACYDD4_13855 [Acidimicrobiales bacterium]
MTTSDVMTELAVVRRQLDQLCDSMQLAGLPQNHSARYEELCTMERELLKLLPEEPTS